MKRNILFIIFGIFCLISLALSLFYINNANNSVEAQSVAETNSSCNRKKVENESEKSEKDKCDFSEYYLLPMRTMKTTSLPIPKVPKDKKLVGCVPVQMLVDFEGNVITACPLSEVVENTDCINVLTDKSYQDAAVEAALKAKFKKEKTLFGRDYFSYKITYNFSQ